jgi:hypothetical protein
MTRPTIRGNTIVLDSGRTVSFPYPVAEAVEYPTVILVRLNVPTGSTFNENVFAVNDHGAIVWQVPKRQYVYADSPYTGMQRQGNDAILFNWDGLQLTVDASTGKVLREDHGK